MCGLVVGLLGWLVFGIGGFQLRRNVEGTALADLPLQRNLVTILQEAEWAPGAIWTGADSMIQSSNHLGHSMSLYPHYEARRVEIHLHTTLTKKRTSVVNMHLPN